jgi:hypothetical protein
MQSKPWVVPGWRDGKRKRMAMIEEVYNETKRKCAAMKGGGTLGKTHGTSRRHGGPAFVS